MLSDTKPRQLHNGMKNYKAGFSSKPDKFYQRSVRLCSRRLFHGESGCSGLQRLRTKLRLLLFHSLPDAFKKVVRHVLKYCESFFGSEWSFGYTPPSAGSAGGGASGAGDNTGRGPPPSLKMFAYALCGALTLNPVISFAIDQKELFPGVYETAADHIVTRSEIPGIFDQVFGQGWEQGDCPEFTDGAARSRRIGTVPCYLDEWLSEGTIPITSANLAILLFATLELAPDCEGDCPGFTDGAERSRRIGTVPGSTLDLGDDAELQKVLAALEATGIYLTDEDMDFSPDALVTQAELAYILEQVRVLQNHGLHKASLESAEVTTDTKEAYELGAAREVITTLPLSTIPHKYPLKFTAQAFDAQGTRLKVSPLIINTKTGVVTLIRSRVGKLKADRQMTFVVKAIGKKLEEKNVALYEHQLGLTVASDGPPVLAETATPSLSASSVGTGKVVIHTFEAATDNAADTLKYSLRFVNSQGKTVTYPFIAFNAKTCALTLNYTALKNYLKLKKISDLTLTYEYTATDKKGQKTTKTNTLTLSQYLTEPTLSGISVNNGVKETVTSAVPITINQTDGQKYRILDNNQAGNWTTIGAGTGSFTVNYALVGDGLHTLTVEILNPKITTPLSATDTVSLYENAPTAATLDINSGAAETTSRTVTLTLAATNATQMRVYESGSTPGNWEAYATTKNFTIVSSGNGEKTIVVDFTNTSGKTTPVTKKINLNEALKPPELPVKAVLPSGYYDHDPLLKFDLPDDAPGGKMYWQMGKYEYGPVPDPTTNPAFEYNSIGGLPLYSGDIRGPPTIVKILACSAADQCKTTPDVFWYDVIKNPPSEAIYAFPDKISNEDFYVTLGCKPGEKNNKIFYTTDGSVPALSIDKSTNPAFAKITITNPATTFEYTGPILISAKDGESSGKKQIQYAVIDGLGQIHTSLDSWNEFVVEHPDDAANAITKGGGYTYEVDKRKPQTPVLNLPGGTYDHDLEITLTTTEPGMKIYYTTSDTLSAPKIIPGVNSVEYGLLAPTIILGKYDVAPGSTGITTIRAVAIKAGVNNPTITSDEVSATYTITKPL